MGDLLLHSRARRSLLLTVSAIFGSRLLPAQNQSTTPPLAGESDDIRLPNGKKQSDEILKADYERNLKDTRELVDTARSFEEDLEKDDRYVLSLSSLKKLDDIERLAKKIRSRLKRY